MEKKEIEIYVNNKTLQQVNSLNYVGIIFDSKLLFRDHINYIEGKCLKLIFVLYRSAKITWGLKHKSLKTIYKGGILPLLLYGATVWKGALNRSCYKAKLNRIQRLIHLKIAKVYRTVSKEALCVINGIIPIHIKIEEMGKLYEITQGRATQYDREMDLENWNHPATHVKTTERDEESSHPIQAYTDGSKSELITTLFGILL